MPGRIMTAATAKKEYGFKSIKRNGDRVTLKNSSGDKVTVSSGTNVYHRGNGNFGIYSTPRDKERHSAGSYRGNRVGKGNYRHTKI